MFAFVTTLFDPTGAVALGFVAGGMIGTAVGRITGRRKSRLTTTLDVAASSAWPTVVAAESENISVSVAPNFRARVRTGRLPLPQRVVELGATEAPGVARVNAFADRLAELPVTAWLEIGRRLTADRDLAQRRSTAWAILDATIADQRLGIAAWYARDAVETSAFVASSVRTRWSSEERRSFARTHGAAEEAALALLAADCLSPKDAALLCVPFAALLPLDAVLHTGGVETNFWTMGV